MPNKFYVLFSLFLLSAAVSQADHLVGGEIFYRCLGGDEYEITLKVYRDCYSTGAPFDNPANISVYDANGALVSSLLAPFNGSDQLEVVINDPCLQAPPDICVEEAVYTTTINLPFSVGGYHIAYQRCCRNISIINLVNPSTQGATYYVHIPEIALSSCNSSPYFNEFPPLALCTGSLLEFDHSASDPDGDLLVYSLCTPYHGGSEADPAPVPSLPPPYQQITWSGGYGSSYPLDATPQLSIDPSTGFLTGIPTQPGQYVVGVCVEEYRNGELLSTNKRDFQFNVVSCESNIAAIIPVQSFFHEPCDGLEVEFGNQSINAEYYHWDFGVTGTFEDVSDLETPVYTYPDTGAYDVMLVANPGYPCADTTQSTVLVYNDVTSEIVFSGDLCFDVHQLSFAAQGDYGSGATFYWEFENGTPATSTDEHPSNIVFDDLGPHQVFLTISEHICSDQSNTELQLYPRPFAHLNLEPLIGCAPLSALFIDSSFAATAHGVFWNLGDGTTSTETRVLHQYSNAGTYDLTLSIYTTEGCIDTSTLTLIDAITVLPLPSGELSVEPDTQFIFDPVFQFSGTSDNAILCELYPGRNYSIYPTESDCTLEFTYSDTGNYEAVMFFTDANGCVMSDTVLIRVEPEVRFWIPNAFTPNDDRINDTWGPKAFGFRDYEIWVFDRWGKQMFHSTDPFEHWNGRYNNQSNHEAVLGVYSYRILAHSVKSRVVKESGHVVILK